MIMLKVDYKKPYGYYTLTQGEKKFKIMLCKANAMWAEMYFYKDEVSIHTSTWEVTTKRRKRLEKRQFQSTPPRGR